MQQVADGIYSYKTGESKDGVHLNLTGYRTCQRPDRPLRRYERMVVMKGVQLGDYSCMYPLEMNLAGADERAGVNKAKRK